MAKIIAAVLKKFGNPLVIEEKESPPLGEEEVLVRIAAAGVCGSDLHICKGYDPRIALPLVLGHEGVGIVEEIRGKWVDLFGKELKEGDLVIWDRGLACGRCYFCTIKKQPSLCPHRQVYGIVRDGCFASHLILISGTKILKIEQNIDPAVLASTVCSGATAAHTTGICDILVGDTVVVQGPGPLGIFAVAFAREKGAQEIIIVGTRRSEKRVELCREFGASSTLIVDDTSEEERVSFVMEKTDGIGAEVVIDCTGSAKAVNEGIKMAAPGGVYALPGVAVPLGNIVIDVYQDVARKNLRIQGVWVSDTSHFYQAVNLVLKGNYPFDKMVTHRFSLQQVNVALKAVEERKAIKAVLISD